MIPTALASVSAIAALLAALVALVAAIGGLIGALVAIPEYRSRLRSQRAEIDTQLATLFSQLVPIANGRGEPRLPDAALAPIIEKLIADDDLDRLRPILRDAYVSAPIGESTQAAAISSIAYLGQTYDSLKEPARACLGSLYLAGYSLLEELRERGLKSLDGSP